jgi:transposase
MLKHNAKQTTFYTALYDKIPENHILKRIDSAIELGFVNELLAGAYCRDLGRPAKEPEMMLRLLILQYLYKLSDVRVIEEANVNLAFLCFLGLNPEDTLPDPSLLAKFRTVRMKEQNIDDILTEIVRQCVEKGIIKKDGGVSIDATHTEANTKKKTPERIMKHLAKKIFRGLEEDGVSVPEAVNTDIPDYKVIEDHKEAKAVMKAYPEEVMKAAGPFAGEKTKKALTEAEEVLADEKFMLQKGVRALCDKDARVGYKSKTDSFFGYKDEFVMTTEERIVTAVNVYGGEHADGTDFDDLIDRTLKSGMNISEVYGDKAYCKPGIYEKIEKIKAEAYIPVSASAYRIDEEFFSYNKDSDQWFCVLGNMTVSKKREEKKKSDGTTKTQYVYGFDKDVCVGCARREACMGKSAAKQKNRKLHVTEDTPKLYELNKRQQSPEFSEKYKKRAAHEGKNAEMKCFHGLDRARGFGLSSVSVQAKLTALAVNLKRIANIVTETKTDTVAATSLFAAFLCVRGFPATVLRCVFRNAAQSVLFPARALKNA